MNWAEFDRTIEEFDQTGQWKPPEWMGEPARAAAPSAESHLIPELPAEPPAGPPLRYLPAPPHGAQRQPFRVARDGGPKSFMSVCARHDKHQHQHPNR